MAHALDQRPFDAYEEPGKTASAVLAIAMHLLLAAVLFFGVSWQSRPPEAVTVELWTAPPPAPAPRLEQPRPEPKPEVRPEPKPEVRPEPKPAPKVEQPDIALEQEKRRLEEERKAREAEAERQRKLAEQKKLEEQKKLAEQKRAEEQKLEERKKAEEQKRLAEEKRRFEQENRQRLNDELARELKGAQTASAGIPGARITGPANVAGATSGDTDAYRARIAAKIKGNVILPMEIAGNPEAEFAVTQLPTGEVLDVRLKKSSGNRTLDEAWERAIRKSSPLPKPDQPEAFRRELTLRFKPRD